MAAFLFCFGLVFLLYVGVNLYFQVNELPDEGDLFTVFFFSSLFFEKLRLLLHIKHSVRHSFSDFSRAL